MLDGNSGSQIVGLTTSNTVALHYLTLQNGFHSGSSGRAMQVYGHGIASQALLANVIVRDSGSDYGTSGVIFEVGGTVTLQDNLIAGNHGPAGAVGVGQAAIVAVYLTNNTVSGNVVTNSSTSIIYIGAGSNVPMVASNNIFWGNSGADLQFINGAMLLTDNDYQRSDVSPANGSSGNRSVDPQFASTTDFHLRASSPLLGSGTTAR